MKIAESSLNWLKTWWVKEKLIVTCNFSFSLCFQKACLPGASKGVIVWEWNKRNRMNMTKLKAFAGDKMNLAKITISLCDRGENTVGKQENAGFQHFFFSHSVFQSLLL